MGGNTSVHFGERAHLGVTGYWAKNDFVLQDERLRFAPSSRLPHDRNTVWAVGLEGAIGFDMVDIFAEFSTMDTGGLAATARSEMGWGPVDLTVSFRYFDKRLPFVVGNLQKGAVCETLWRNAGEVGGAAAKYVHPAYL